GREGEREREREARTHESLKPGFEVSSHEAFKLVCLFVLFSILFSTSLQSSGTEVFKSHCRSFQLNKTGRQGNKGSEREREKERMRERGKKERESDDAVGAAQT